MQGGGWINLFYFGSNRFGIFYRENGIATAFQFLELQIHRRQYALQNGLQLFIFIHGYGHRFAFNQLSLIDKIDFVDDFQFIEKLNNTVGALLSGFLYFIFLKVGSKNKLSTYFLNSPEIQQ